MILDVDGNQQEDLVTCDGKDAAIREATECYVPLTTLIGPTFLLQQGDLVRVAVSAQNSIGTSDFSTVNTDGAQVETKPQAPAPPARMTATSYLQIAVEWTELVTPAEKGGSDILSYQLDWDAGQSQNVWQDLVGYQSAYLGLTHTETNVIPGITYVLRLRA